MSWHVMLDVADLHVKVQLLHYMCHGVWCDRCGRHGFKGEYPGPHDTELHSAAAHADGRL